MTLSSSIMDFKTEYLFTESTLTERIKQELAKVPLHKDEYLSEIRESKKTRGPNQNYFDYDQERDFSINPDDPKSISRKLYDDKWYYYKAHHYLRIGAFQRKDVPLYKISLSHLSREVIKELYSFDVEERNYILKQAVAKIFEDVNFDLYHNSVSSRLEVKLTK